MQPQQIIALLNDPQQMSQIDGVLKVEVLKVHKNCKDIKYTIPHFLLELEYIAQACLQDNRIELTLLESEDLSSFTSSWLIEPTEQGSLITYSIRSIPTFPLPLFIIRSQTQSSVESFFKRFISHINSTEFQP